MRKLFCMTAVLAAFAVPAQAQEMHFKPYLGFDLQRINLDYNSTYNAGGGIVLDGNTLLDDKLDGFNIHVGNRFHRHFGLELGYFRTKDASKNVSAGATIGPGLVAGVPFSTKIRLQGVTLDGMGYIPVDSAERFELIGTAGISYAWGRAEFNMGALGLGTITEKDNEFGFRAGAGAQFNITDRINVRGLARYQTADFDEVVDNAWIYSVGLNFSF